ncbi:MAG: hypothetical protein OXC03_07285 [Flavobacteriaceae bacterium]|nr:hypothetical protein [Flavobacteriaceae bacterium]
MNRLILLISFLFLTLYYCNDDGPTGPKLPVEMPEPTNVEEETNTEQTDNDQDNNSTDETNDDNSDQSSTDTDQDSNADETNDDNGDQTSTDTDQDNSEDNFSHTVLPDAIEDLFEMKGDIESDTVWVYIQGGAVLDRDYPLNSSNSSGCSNCDQDEAEVFDYPYFVDDLIVYPFQSQHLNPYIHRESELTFEQAKIESALSAEIIKKVIDHFNTMEKTIYLIGHSYGAFLVNEILSKYGSIARKSISLNGRLDMDQVVVDGFSEGIVWLFDENGQNPYEAKVPEEYASEIKLISNLSKLNAGLGFNRYTEKLAEVDLSDAIFLFSEYDMNVGDFTPEAIKLLKETNPAEHLIILENGTHETIFADLRETKKLHDLIIMDN